MKHRDQTEDELIEDRIIKLETAMEEQASQIEILSERIIDLQFDINVLEDTHADAALNFVLSQD